MTAGTVRIERTLNAPAAKVWKAVTDRDEMKHWYFDLSEFKPQVGFTFQFWGENEGRRFLHICIVTEVIPEKKISYSWRYDGFEGSSHVTIELTADGMRTKLVLTHEGLDTFPSGNPDFAYANFAAGWTAIIGTGLKEFVEK